MHEYSQIYAFLILALEVIIIVGALTALFWHLYRKSARKAKHYESAAAHLARRRDAYLQWLTQSLRELTIRSSKAKPEARALLNLERRLLEEEKTNTEAARDRDTDFWDLRMASTKVLVDLLRQTPVGEGKQTEEPGTPRADQKRIEQLNRKVADRDKLLDRQRYEIQQLVPYRDAWLKLHKQAARERDANAALRKSLRQLQTDQPTREAIDSALDAYVPYRDAIDDYLAATAASYDQASPEQKRRSRRRQHRANRLHQVVDAASERMESFNKEFGELVEDQRQAIADLESKLQRAEEARDVVQQNYNRDMRRLKKLNRNAENNVRSLEKENFRLRQRVRNLIRLTSDEEAPFIPAPNQKGGREQDAEIKRKDAELERLQQQLREVKAKNAKLEADMERYRTLEHAIQSTLHTEAGNA